MSTADQKKERFS